jgi:hypothetical protein
MQFIRLCPGFRLISQRPGLQWAATTPSRFNLWRHSVVVYAYQISPALVQRVRGSASWFMIKQVDALLTAASYRPALSCPKFWIFHTFVNWLKTGRIPWHRESLFFFVVSFGSCQLAFLRFAQRYHPTRFSVMRLDLFQQYVSLDSTCMQLTLCLVKAALMKKRRMNFPWVHEYRKNLENLT